MRNFRRIAAGFAVIAAAILLARGTSVPLIEAAFAAGDDAYGMRNFTNQTYRFSFWYPAALQIKASKTNNAASFPGGIEVETIEVGPPGDVVIHVVDSPRSTITDEPNGHAAPIGQTKYFYDASAKRWLVAFPEGTSLVGEGATKPADISKTTLGGLLMLPGGARFDTTIIPLSKTRFLVVQDGGGSGFTDQLARTVALVGARIDASALKAALRDEAAAFAKQ